ncbi:class I SAM-dependent methyltransferase [Streptomyces sp. NBC_00083]|uniref:class I SAM-dependent methyltransferase n=1 Tax=Streptomyces sp. NBC_00083 TaxID=2975647 RepID=UPI002258118A|nr:class I SAM-dependent methyltransferase [Streptomyces sp. NBC_00083]MCX5386869.1 class I SAM-dependent methyltransferase [Streptomyces sp. NBC_00083]
MKCRSCASALGEPVLDLGFAPPSNAYLSAARLSEPEVHLPLRARFCTACTLLQLEEQADPRSLFTPDYAYRSGTSRSWLAHVEAFARSAIERLRLDPRSRVVEIGCNDGHLLEIFAARGIPTLGIEPAVEAARTARAAGLDVIDAFFSARLAAGIANRRGRADLVVANNVFAHVPDINGFAEGLAAVTKPQGVVTLEFPHVLSLLRHAQFDTIYHEHFSYLSLRSARHVLEGAGLEIFDVEQLTTHGGSLRIHAQHHGAGRPLAPGVHQLVRTETEAGLAERATYTQLQRRAETIKDDLLRFLLDARRRGARVCAYGAAAKGNTLLNFAGVHPDLLPVVYDAAPSKQGQYLPGSHIPIEPASSLDAGDWDYVLILPWNLADEVIAQLTAPATAGTTFVVAVPELTLLRAPDSRTRYEAQRNN